MEIILGLNQQNFQLCPRCGAKFERTERNFQKKDELKNPHSRVVLYQIDIASMAPKLT